MSATPETAPAFAWFLMACDRDIHRWRRLVAGVLRTWGAPRPAVELACAGVSELLSNVLRHAGDPRCRIELDRIGTTAVVRVVDRSRRLPVVAEPEWDAESGRGLWMLQRMTDGTLATRLTDPPWGKAVSFTCPLVPAP